MNNIELELKDALEYISDNILDIRIAGENINNAKYHHNTSYNNAPLVCKYGILTLYGLNKNGIRNDSNNFLKLMGDIDSHVNGNDCVSLSVVGLTDLYPNEWEYDPYNPDLVDFLISNDIKAGRSSTNYGNEFLKKGSISIADLRSVDIRLLKLIKKQLTNSDDQILSVLSKYNNLINIANELNKQKLCIPLREMSDRNIYSIDINKLLNQPKLVLKK